LPKQFLPPSAGRSLSQLSGLSRAANQQLLFVSHGLSPRSFVSLCARRFHRARQSDRQTRPSTAGDRPWGRYRRSRFSWRITLTAGAAYLICSRVAVETLGEAFAQRWRVTDRPVRSWPGGRHGPQIQLPLHRPHRAGYGDARMDARSGLPALSLGKSPSMP
jgi:hypothetical protein